MISREQAEARLMAAIEEQMVEYPKVVSGASGGRYAQMLAESGAIGTAERLNATSNIQQGFTDAILAGRPDLTIEWLVLVDRELHRHVNRDALINMHRKISDSLLPDVTHGDQA